MGYSRQHRGDSKMKSKLRIGAFALLMLLMAGCIALQYQRGWGTEQAVTSQLEIENQAIVGELQKGLVVSQTFTADRNFSGISLLMATYNKTVYGKIHIKLLEEESGQALVEKSFYTASMKDNKPFYFMFGKEIEVESPKQYRLVVESGKGRIGSHVTIWNSLEDQESGGSLYINGERQEGDLVFDFVYQGKEVFYWGMFLHRASLFLLFFGFLGLHCFVGIKELYQWIFEKRVWVALALFVFMVLNKYHFSSIEQFDWYIQPGEGTEYTSAVMGKSRAIRSDEWMLGVPRFLSAEYSDYGKYNEVVRAEKTTNLSASGLYRSYSALAQPMAWGFYLFGSEYGLSFRWCFYMIFGFLFSYEFCLLLTKRKKLLSLLGASLIWFSSCNMWWSAMNWILAGEAALVCTYYFLGEPSRKKRVLWGIGIAIFGSCFAVVDLYPAWQVPAGYLYLLILIWMLAGHWQGIKGYQWKDWAIAAGSILFLASIAGVFLLNDAEYLTDIMNTRYPGMRVSYGGKSIHQLLGYLPTFLMGWKDYTNPSEAGRFASFFPIPYVLSLVWFLRSKKKDLLMGLLLGGTTFLSLYCVMELPELVAKVFLLTFSTPERTAVILGYAQILLLIVMASRQAEEERLRLPVGLAVVSLTAAATLWYSKENFEGYLNILYFIAVAVVVFGAILPVISRVKESYRSMAVAALSIFTIVTGLSVHPLMCGLDAIKGKPAAAAVADIVESDKDGKWLAVDDIAAGNFLIACGAPAVNSVNYIPNMELWAKLDPDGEKEEIYNRYAHIVATLTKEETDMELYQTDVINLDLSYHDLEKLGIDYIFAKKPVESQEDVAFEALYQEAGCHIYKVMPR